MRRSMNLRTALTLLALATLTPAIGVVINEIGVHRQEAANRDRESTRDSARAVAQQLQSPLSDALNNLDTLASHPAITGDDPDACRKVFVDTLHSHSSFTSMGAIRPDGTLKCAVGNVLDPKDLPPDRQARFNGFVLRAISSTTAALIEYVGPEDRRLLAVARPTKKAAPSDKLLLFATISFRERVDQEAMNTVLSPGWTLTLVANDGTVIIREPPRDDIPSGLNIASSPLAARIARGRGDTDGTAVDLDGETRMFGTAPVQGWGSIAIGVPVDRDDRLAQAHFLRLFSGIGTAVVLLALALWFGLEAFVLGPVRSMHDSMRNVAAGTEGDRSRAKRGARELTQLGEAFDDMVDSLERSLGETRHALAIVRENQARLQHLSRALIEGQEAERSHLARELHDEVGQALTAATLNLDALRESAAAGDEGDRRVDEALEVVRRALNQVRDLSLDLHPSMLDDLGLVPALRWYLARQSERSGVPMALQSAALGRRLPKEIEVACFRITQEAVVNALRHGHPRRLDVEVGLAGDEVVLVVRDDGCGFDTEAARDHARHGGSLGIIGMQERATLLGGHLEIESEPGAGTAIRAALPIGTEAEAATPEETTA